MRTNILTRRSLSNFPCFCPPIAAARTLLTAWVLTGIAGCVTTPAGSIGYDAFMAEASPTELTGTRNAAKAAQCFENTATFLPLSSFSHDASSLTFYYRLRVSDLWFEEVRITPKGEGSRAELRVAPNLDTRWLGQLERDRLAPLRQCLGS